MKTATLLDGKAAAAEIKRELAVRVEALKSAGVEPGLGTILVGDDPGSRSYVAGKHRDCQQVGIACLPERSIGRRSSAASTDSSARAASAASLERVSSSSGTSGSLSAQVLAHFPGVTPGS